MRVLRQANIATIALSLVTLILLAVNTPAQANIDGPTAHKIALQYAGRPFDSFRSFMAESYFNGEAYSSKADHKAIGEFATDETLTPIERETLFRLLGVYAQLKYGGDAM
ncbi:MAG: hypothetical protein ACI9FR_002981 [Cryomorphaceae bacterium]|jgi:hypothetical protein